MSLQLSEMLRGKRVAVLTGAGCSTESGIPDYRGAGARPRSPIQHQDFIKHEATRRRYWARSTVGWPRFCSAEPNRAHRALARLEARGCLTGIVTQNVDRLHHKAGSRAVLELHGALADVRCLGCNQHESRDSLQERILADNPTLRDFDATVNPDGDAEDVPDEDFRVATCTACSGVLKPDVVFFGGSVPRAKVDEAFTTVEAADVLLVVGSSLAVYSGYRFVVRARDREIPIAIVNRGETRGDEHARLRVDGSAGEVLSELEERL
jgi:NAD+-dependent protein deacetylase sirtuin 4